MYARGLRSPFRIGGNRFPGRIKRLAGRWSHDAANCVSQQQVTACVAVRCESDSCCPRGRTFCHGPPVDGREPSPAKASGTNRCLPQWDRFNGNALCRPTVKIKHTPTPHCRSATARRSRAPYIVALMTELVQPSPKKRVLDIGTGSGYQAAVLAKLCKHVYSIEIVEPLAQRGSETLDCAGLHKCQRPLRRRLSWLAGERAVRHHCSGRSTRPRSAGTRRSTRTRRPACDPCRPKLPEVAVDSKGHAWLVQRREVLPVKFVPMTGQAQTGEEVPLVMGCRCGKHLALVANAFSCIRVIGQRY